MIRQFILSYENKKLLLDDKEYNEILNRLCDEVEDKIVDFLATKETIENMRILIQYAYREIMEKYRYRPVRFIATDVNDDTKIYYFRFEDIVAEFRYDNYRSVYLVFYVD